jgi:hypothetical protein
MAALNYFLPNPIFASAYIYNKFISRGDLTMSTEKKLEEIERLLRSIEYKVDESMSQLDNIENLLDERFDELLKREQRTKK